MIGSIRSRHARSPGRPDFRKEAAAQGVSVFFITGRGELQPEAKADNLKPAGSGMALRGPHPKDQSVTEYKSGAPKKVADAGYHIILNVGDPLSDLNRNPQAEALRKAAESALLHT